MTDIQLDIFTGKESFNFDELKKTLKKKTNRNMKEYFVLEYLKNGCKNATQSAIKAGYSKKTAKSKASQLLKEKQVRFLIEKHTTKIKKELLIDSKFLALETLEFLKIAKGEKSKISQVIQNEKIDGINHDVIKTFNLKNYSETAHKAGIEILGKLTGSFSEKKEIDHNFNIEDLKKENISSILEKNYE